MELSSQNHGGFEVLACMRDKMSQYLDKFNRMIANNVKLRCHFEG